MQDREPAYVCKPHQFTEAATASLCLPVEPGDPIIEEYRLGQSPNEYMLRVMLETTREGDRVLDLGCHVGTFSVGAAALKRKVVAVDASADHVTFVKASGEANGFADFSVHWRAIDEKRKTVRIVERGIWTSIVDAPSPDAVEVPACTLDELVAQAGGGKVDFLKMDIEGSEYGAIRSGQKLLRESGPVILFESNGMTAKEVGHSVDEIRAELEGIGYKVFRIEGSRWVYAPVGELQPEAWVDMLALNERHQQMWADRIDWKWGIDAMYDRCVWWSQLPYVNTRQYLLEELTTRKLPWRYRWHHGARFKALAATLKSGLAG